MLLPEAEATMRLCRNLFGKFVKWQLGNFIFWRVLAIWIHCGAPCARCRIRRPRVEVLWSRVRSSVRPQWCWPQQPQKYFVTQCVICCYAIFLVLLKKHQNKTNLIDIFGCTHIYLAYLHISCYGPIGVFRFKRQVALLLITKSAAQIQM